MDAAAPVVAWTQRAGLSKGLAAAPGCLRSAAASGQPRPAIDLAARRVTRRDARGTAVDRSLAGALSGSPPADHPHDRDRTRSRAISLWRQGIAGLAPLRFSLGGGALLRALSTGARCFDGDRSVAEFGSRCAGAGHPLGVGQRAAIGKIARRLSAGGCTRPRGICRSHRCSADRGRRRAHQIARRAARRGCG